MSHSFTNLLCHVVFATKGRQPWLEADLRPRLFAYLGGLARATRCTPLAINGMTEHVHMLMKLHPDQAISSLVRAVKAKSSRWIHQTIPGLECFTWQTGYGAFSVSQSQMESVRHYIQNQEEHHRTMPYTDEIRQLIRLHGLDVAEEALWE